MTMLDSYLPLECMPPTTGSECTFCDNTADANYDVNYPMTGLVRHCVDCAIEFGVDQTGRQKLSTEDIHIPEVAPRHAV